jgi:LytS/YehU family sensor histidine kinase
MRMIVDNSKKEWISLADEIHFLQLYLELEKLRLGDTFTSSIITDGNIHTTQLYIPPMLIQPFIENSLKHGLAGKPGEKILEIHFSLQEKMVYCRIKDNGIGRVQAKAISARSKQNVSMGIANINERLQLLHTKSSSNKEYIIITDLYDDTVPAGTLVEIYVPYIIEN